MFDFDNDEQVKAHAVRLFPAAHISSEREAELRATAAFLSMVRAVSEFGRVFTRAAAAPAGQLSCFTEVEFQVDTGSGPYSVRPDGIVVVRRGRKEWKALVEVKVGDSPLTQEQFDEYHRLAGDQEFDAVLTISNQPALPNGLPPLSVDKRRLRRVPVFHFSWERLLSEARLLSRKKAVEDPDQRWMLEEWIKYVADAASKIIEAPQLGKHWHDVLQAARQGDLRVASRDLEDVVEHWDGFLMKAALRLRAELGVEVQRKVPRSERREPAERLKRLHAETLETGRLSGELRIPDAAGDLTIDVDLHAKVVRYGIVINPPNEGRASTRVNWLTRQLRKCQSAPGDTVIRIDWDQRGLTSWAKLSDLRKDESAVMRDPSRMPIPRSAFPKKFCLEWTRELQRGRSRSTANVLSRIFDDLEKFYQNIVEGLVRYQPRAPKLSKEVSSEPMERASTKEQPTPSQGVAEVARPSEPSRLGPLVTEGHEENQGEPVAAPSRPGGEPDERSS